jgi:RNA polymerase-binding transcription factor DksA
MLTQEFIDKMKARLLEEKETLLRDLAGLQLHTDVGDESDENATEVQIDDVNKDLMARMQDDLAKVEKALQKIEEGTYGTDDDGNEISEARLEAIPWADKAI